jgi:transcriptional regulator
MSKGKTKFDVLQGTLDLMVLRTLETMGPQHGFGLAKRILRISDGLLDLNQGTLYPALLRLEQHGWIRARWGISENNRRARFYELTKVGRRRIDVEERDWEQTASLMRRFLRSGEEG